MIEPRRALMPLLGAGAAQDVPPETTRSKKKRTKLLYCEAQTMFLDIASETLARIRLHALYTTTAGCSIYAEKPIRSI